MGGKKSRTKGHGYEREVAARLREFFPDARRKLEYQSEEATGIDIAGTGEFKFQCKRYKGYVPISKIDEIKEDGIKVLVTKADHKEAMAVLSFEDFCLLIKGFLNDRAKRLPRRVRTKSESKSKKAQFLSSCFTDGFGQNSDDGFPL